MDIITTEKYIPIMRRIPKTDGWIDMSHDDDSAEVFDPIYTAFLYAHEQYEYVDFKLATQEGIIYGIEYNEELPPEPEPEPDPEPEEPRPFSLYGEYE